MCTVIVLYRLLPTHPVMVAGNRDEFLTRSSLAPHVWTVQGRTRPVRIFAGKDQKEGGTWFGINQDGLVVGVTNRYTGTRDTDQLSRGQLVLKCLTAHSVDEVSQILTPEEVSRYNPFNLFCLSEEGGLIVTHDTEGFQTLGLSPGIHVLTNRGPDDPDDAKKQWLRSRLGEPHSDPETVVDRISEALSHHGEGDESPSVCVHLPGYATVSSCMLFLSNASEQSRYLYADGSPCRTPFQDLTPGLLDLFAFAAK